MNWYGVSIIMSARVLEGEQTQYLVWESVHLVRAADSDEAARKAQRLGEQAMCKPGQSFSWNGREARWSFEGIRKIITIQPHDSGDLPTDGAEITYNELLLSSAEDVRKLAEGKEVSAIYLE